MNERDKKLLTHNLAKVISEDNLISLAIVVKVGQKILKDNDSEELLQIIGLPTLGGIFYD